MLDQFSPARRRPAAFSALAFILLGVLCLGLPTLAQEIGRAPANIAPLNPPFAMAQLERPSFPEQTFDISNYGATQLSDTQSEPITEAISAAIDAAHAAGGGRVLVPAGNWLSGPIHLKSNINLHLEKGATIYFSTDKDDYLPVVPQRYEGVETYNYSPMIYANQVNNVAITGEGTLDAQGEHWWLWFQELGTPDRKQASKVPLAERAFGKGADVEGMRPNFVVFWKSENILVEGIALKNTPMWNLHMVYSNNIIVRDVKIDSKGAPNGDGIVLDSSQNALIEYNQVQTADQGVVLKSGLNAEGLQIDIPTENVIVRHFVAKNSGPQTSGVVFGSETSGGLRNIFIHNALFQDSDRGIYFKTERGRGNEIENIYIRNATMKHIKYEAISFNSFFTGPSATGPAPTVRNIHIGNITIDTVPTALTLVGLPEKWLENITLENVQILNAEMGAKFTRVKNLVMNNVSIKSQSLALYIIDSYQVKFNKVELEDQVPGGELRLEGRYTGAVELGENLTLENLQFGKDVPKNAVLSRPLPQAEPTTEPESAAPADNEPSVNGEPSANQEPSVDKVPSANQEPSAVEKPSADEEQSTIEESSAGQQPSAPTEPAPDTGVEN